MNQLVSHVFNFSLILSLIVLPIFSTGIFTPSNAQAFGSLTENGTAAFMGIGVTPQKILHVSGTGPGTVPLFVRGTDSAGFIIERTPTNRWVLGVNESPTLGNGFVLSTIPTGTQSVPRLMITPGGNVGIGTINPISGKLQVENSGDPAIYGVSSTGNALEGHSTGGHGLYAVSTSEAGAEGHSTDSPGLEGYSTNGYGVYGQSDNNYSIYGRYGGTGPSGYLGGAEYGVYGQISGGSNYGYIGSASNGVYGSSNSGHGVYGNSIGGTGVYGSSNSGEGVKGYSANDIGVYGKTDNVSSYAGYFEGNVNITDNLTANYVKGNGICLNGDCRTSWPTGSLPSGTAGQTLRYDGSNWMANNLLYNNGTCIGVGKQNDLNAILDVQANNTVAISGISNNNAGVYGKNISWGSYGYLGYSITGVYGKAEGTNAQGVAGESENGTGVYGKSDYGHAGYFDGNVHLNGDEDVTGSLHVAGTLTKGSGTFKIDHPQDPENKYLQHSFVESPEMINIYRGTAILDANGEAIVELPAYFESLNRDYDYQLTCIKGYAPVYIAEEIYRNSFKIAGGKSGLKVSWMVTGARQDVYANAHPIVVEQEKTANEKGYYLHPAEWGQPEEKGISQLNK